MGECSAQTDGDTRLEEKSPPSIDITRDRGIGVRKRRLGSRKKPASRTLNSPRIFLEANHATPANDEAVPVVTRFSDAIAPLVRIVGVFDWLSVRQASPSAAHPRLSHSRQPMRMHGRHPKRDGLRKHRVAIGSAWDSIRFLALTHLAGLGVSGVPR